jgi:hypothetical protein
MVATLLIATVVGLSPAKSCYGQENLAPTTPATTEPVVVVTVGSLNALVQDVNYITDALGMGQFGGTFELMTGMFARGIDRDQPVGVIVPLVDGTPEPIAMLPVKDVKQMLKQLEAQTGPVDELDDGTLVINIGANVVFIRQLANWAVLARSRNVLDQAPVDPTTVISEMGSDYDLAVRLDLQQIPPAVRNALTGQLRQGFDQAMSRQGGADAESTLPSWGSGIRLSTLLRSTVWASIASSTTRRTPVLPWATVFVSTCRARAATLNFSGASA